MPKTKQPRGPAGVKQSMVSGSQARGGNSRVHMMQGSKQGGGKQAPLLKTQFSVENMISLNQQNARLKQHVLLFIEKLEGFIGKANMLKEEKRK